MLIQQNNTTLNSKLWLVVTERVKGMRKDTLSKQTDVGNVSHMDSKMAISLTMYRKAPRYDTVVRKMWKVDGNKIRRTDPYSGMGSFLRRITTGST